MKAVKDAVFVIVNTEDEVKNGLYIPYKKDEHIQVGEVVSFGSKVEETLGCVIHAGDIVVFTNPHYLLELTGEGDEKITIINADSIVGIDS